MGYRQARGFLLKLKGCLNSMERKNLYTDTDTDFRLKRKSLDIIKYYIKLIRNHTRQDDIFKVQSFLQQLINDLEEQSKK